VVLCPKYNFNFPGDSAGDGPPAFLANRANVRWQTAAG
jgi:hypothetical protein